MVGGTMLFKDNPPYLVSSDGSVKQLPELKVYVVSHVGRYLSGYSIAFAETAEEAKEMVVSLLKEHKFEPIIFKVIKPSSSGATIIWDGDY